MRTRFPSMLATWVASRTIRHHGTRGQVLPLIALGAIALFSMAALAVDVGYWNYQQRLEQSAADSAAMAGAIELLYAPNPSSAPNPAVVTARAQADAASNGYADDGGATVNVIVTTPYAGDNTAVHVVVEKKNQPVFFAGVAGIFGNVIQIDAQAVARNTGPGTTSSCVVALSGALTINGGAAGFLAPNCGIVADAGMTINGNSNGLIEGQYIGVVGDLPTCGVTKCTEALPTEAIAQPDPCASIVSCEYLTANGYGSPILRTPAPGQTVFLPGKYATTFKPGTATLLPGMYVFEDGMTVTGTDVVTGTGVTIYNEHGSISTGGNTTINLTAPATGPGAGIAIYQPPMNTSPDSLKGGGAVGLTGMIYAPTADITLDGSNPNISELVAGSMTINGQGVKVNNTGIGNSGNPLLIGHATLVQ
jgi:hypothetical protein